MKQEPGLYRWANLQSIAAKDRFGSKAASWPVSLEVRFHIRSGLGLIWNGPSARDPNATLGLISGLGICVLAVKSANLERCDVNVFDTTRIDRNGRWILRGGADHGYATGWTKVLSTRYGTPEISAE